MWEGGRILKKSPYRTPRCQSWAEREVKVPVGFTLCVVFLAPQWGTWGANNNSCWKMIHRASFVTAGLNAFLLSWFSKGPSQTSLDECNKTHLLPPIQGITQMHRHSLQAPNIKARHAEWWMLSPLMETLRGIYPSLFIKLVSNEWGESCVN